MRNCLFIVFYAGLILGGTSGVCEGLSLTHQAGATHFRQGDAGAPIKAGTIMVTAQRDAAAPRPEARTADADGNRVVVGEILFDIEKDGTEKVCFRLTHFSNLNIFSLEGSNPRIVIDITDVKSWHGKPTMSVDGVLIRQVRTHFHSAKRKLRIVLDLTPSMDYTAEPIYYKAESIYCVAIAAK